MNKIQIVRSFAVLTTVLAATSLGHAQGRGGRGGTPLNPAQQAALSRTAAPISLVQAVNDARDALVSASLASPSRMMDINARARELADAEFNLAIARADGFASAQQLLKPVTPEQAMAFTAPGGNVEPDATRGWTALFNGRDLAGWDGDPMFWSVQDGVVVAESTPERVVGQQFPGNTFLIWQGGNVSDFEFKVDYRFASGGGNSGVQFRSRMADPETRPWGIAGYQMDMVAAGGTGSGVVYTEGGGFGLLPQATAIRATEDGARLIGTLGTGAADAINPSPGWNTYHIIAKGNVVAAFVNGRMTAFLVDDNPSGAQYAAEGLLALQMHQGAPFRLEFRNAYLREL